jgi:hypothetical protein
VSRMGGRAPASSMALCWPLWALEVGGRCGGQEEVEVRLLIGTASALIGWDVNAALQFVDVNRGEAELSQSTYEV